MALDFSSIFQGLGQLGQTKRGKFDQISRLNEPMSRLSDSLRRQRELKEGRKYETGRDETLAGYDTERDRIKAEARKAEFDITSAETERSNRAGEETDKVRAENAKKLLEAQLKELTEEDAVDYDTAVSAALLCRPAPPRRWAAWW